MHFRSPVLPAPHRLLALLLMCDALLVAAHALGPTLSTVSSTAAEWVHLNSEANIPTWFASSQLLLVAGLAFAFGRTTSDAPLARFHAVVAAAFLLFSLDETAQFHEGFSLIVAKLGFVSPFPERTGAWILAYAAAAIPVALVCRRAIGAFWSHRVGRAPWLAGMGLLIGGAVCVELLGYYFASVGMEGVPRTLATAVEETAELTGVSLVAYATALKLAPRSVVATAERVVRVGTLGVVALPRAVQMATPGRTDAIPQRRRAR